MDFKLKGTSICGLYMNLQSSKIHIVTCKQAVLLPLKCLGEDGKKEHPIAGYKIQYRVMKSFKLISS